MKNIPTFESFVNEYQTYSQFKKGWGTPEDLKMDVTISVKHLIPTKWDEAEKQIKSIEDVSDDSKGIKFEIKLKDGDVIHAFKVGQFRGSWEWYLNKKKMQDSQIRKQIEDKMYKPYDKWLRHYDMSDKYYMYADDPRAYDSGKNHDVFVQKLYNELSASDKKKADQHIEKSEK
jgi:Asp-tRNA(Asn)/Glu-tRNA(Gln) amidotransferase B subunit